MDKTEKRIIDIIDQHRQEIIDFAQDIYCHAELGYKEFRTSEKFKNWMEKLGLPITDNLAITGVKAYLNSEKKNNISLSLIGEMDALKIPSHPFSHPETGAAHCCGHHAQLAGVVGAAIALSNPEIAQSLDGQIVFFAVPAEEYGEIEFKNTLVKEGKIQYGGGKCELIRVGAFEDIDMSIVHHTYLNRDIEIGAGTNNGFVSKVIRIEGKAAHAAFAPEEGINALNAASLGLSALAYQRETFKDEDCVRVHPIQTAGGDLVNVVPDTAVLETLVRAKSKDAIADAARKTDRAFIGAALALGAHYKIETAPGYLPTLPSQADSNVLEAASLANAGHSYVIREADYNVHSGGSTDVGDLEHIQPVLSFSTGGIEGSLHTPDFRVVDEELAYITTAKIFALTTYRLLKDSAQAAKDIVNNYHAPLTKESYVEYMERLFETRSSETDHIASL